MRIQKVGVLSMGKTGGAVFAAIALVAGVLVAVIALSGVAVSRLSGQGNFLGQQEMLLTVTVTLLGGPIIYGLLGFIGGVVSAVAYNVVARRFGGLEIELEQWPPATGSPQPPEPSQQSSVS
jgi:hypothetical protein